MAWTKPQQAAIDKRDADILVSAAAGSGKTAVLTERVINRIIGTDTERPIDLERFLIVTFTSAAANEMKERISHKLSDKIAGLQEQEDALKSGSLAAQKIAYLEKQLAHIQTASISTIHAFCLKVIKTYFNKLGIDPNIKVGNEAELSIMKLELLEEMIEERFEEDDEDFMEIAEVYGSVQGMAPLVNIILDLHSFSKSTPFPEVWLDEKTEVLCRTYTDLEKLPWSQAIKSNIIGQMKDIIVLYQEAMALCTLANGPELYLEVLQEDYRQIEAALNQNSLDKLSASVSQIVFTALPRKKQSCDEVLKERVKAYRDLGKEVIKEIQEHLVMLNDPKILHQLPQIGRRMQIIVSMIKDFEARYQEAKQNAGLADYNDLEHLCMQVLIEPQFDNDGKFKGIIYTDEAKELSQFYKEIYIDEYQDSNTVQEMILAAVAEAARAEEGEVPTRFMVGDMKQSIYRFRLANPLIFADKYERWEKHLEEGNNHSKEVCIDLSQNFRSRKNVLCGVNDLFEQLMSKEVGELEYDDYAKLREGNLFSEGNPEELKEDALSGAIELHILETHTKDEEEDGKTDEGDLESLKNIEIEALMTANLIDKLLKGEGNPSHLFDKELDAYRKVEPRDIVILLRATKEKAMVFEKALAAKGIGAYADVSSSFFEAIEIQTMIAFMKIIDNPCQDIPLITVMRSPIVGASLDDLALIRSSADTGCFYEALKLYLLRDDAKESIKHFAEQLIDYRMQTSQFTIEELLAKIYAETGYYRYAAMLPTGVKKKANLGILRKYASEFEISHNGQLFSFLQYLDKLRETSEGLGEAKLTSDNENLVRIMSIHKSKGLEFGIVFLCDTAKRFNNKDIAKSILLHSELGIAPDFIDTEYHVQYATIPKLAVKNQITAENISEEMRVLYVALTRAKEKLFITGVVSDFVKKASNWSLFAVRNQKAILPLGVKRAGSYLNWIGMSLFAHSGIEDIRKAAQLEDIYLFQGESSWQLTLWDKSSLSLKEQNAQAASENKKEIFDNWDTLKAYGAYKEEIYKRLSFKYPYEKAIILPTKLSVSEIKNNFTADSVGHSPYSKKEEYRVPRFISNEAEISGAQRGTLIHSVFEHLDFLRFTTGQEIQEELKKLAAQHKIKQEALEAADINRFASFACSEMVGRIKKAKHVWKEKQFVYLADAHEIDEDYPENEKLLIQGVIDTFFLEEDGMVILDYKTDYIDQTNLSKSLENIKERYKRQLELYAQALEKITKKPVKEKYIYLYHIDKWMAL